MHGREIAERYARCHNAPWDRETMGSLLHPDDVEDRPRSGERIVGFENR